VKTARALERRAVLSGDAAVLPQMLRPRFNQEILDVPLRPRDIGEQAPEYGTIAVSDCSDCIHCQPELLSHWRVDLVFD
jgi:hypothetical protein